MTKHKACYDGKVKQEQGVNIGQAALQSGVSAKMIRYYEQSGLLAPAHRSESNYRQYGDRDVQTLRFIKRSRDLGFSLDRIRTLLALWKDTDRRSVDVKSLAQQYIQELNDDIAKLQSIRDELERLAQCCHGDNRPDCPIIADLASKGRLKQ